MSDCKHHFLGESMCEHCGLYESELLGGVVEDATARIASLEASLTAAQQMAEELRGKNEALLKIVGDQGRAAIDASGKLDSLRALGFLARVVLDTCRTYSAPAILPPMRGDAQGVEACRKLREFLDVNPHLFVLSKEKKT